MRTPNVIRGTTMAQHIGRRSRVQPLAPIRTRNAAGGLATEITPSEAFVRLLLLGTEGGTFYETERDLTVKAAEKSIEFIQSSPRQAYNILKDVVNNNRAPRMKSVIFGHALCITFAPTEGWRSMFAEDAPYVEKTLSMLMSLTEEMKHMRGKGSTFKRAIYSWIGAQNTPNLVYQFAKYSSRGWSYLDLLRVSHMRPTTPIHRTLAEIAKARANGERLTPRSPLLQEVPEEQRHLLIIRDLLFDAQNEQEILLWLKKYPKFITWEMIPTHFLTPKVWEALLANMPIEATIRNLGQLESKGIFKDKTNRDIVITRLSNTEALKKAHVHPLQPVLANAIYSQGHGMRGQLTWTPHSDIQGVLEQSFYDLMKISQRPYSGHILVAVDMSGSVRPYHGMARYVRGYPLSIAYTEAAIMMAVGAMYNNVSVVGYNTHPVYFDWYSNEMTLHQVASRIEQDANYGTDCTVPIRLFTEDKELPPFDIVLVLTDGQHWAGGDPMVAMNEYRAQRNKPDALLVESTFAAYTDSVVEPYYDSRTIRVVGVDPAMMDVGVELSKMYKRMNNPDEHHWAD